MEKKGETSGHLQKIKEIRIDCDMDSVLLLVEQIGGACHMGYRSCFYRNLEGDVVGEKVFELKMFTEFNYIASITFAKS